MKKSLIGVLIAGAAVLVVRLLKKKPTQAAEDTEEVFPYFPFPLSDQKQGTYLVFDTETTGLPIDRKLPPSEVDNWPRVVSIAWLLFDDQRRIIDVRYQVVQQEAPIPEEATKIHGITYEIAEGGASPKEIFAEFAEAISRTKYIVAHNIAFDAPIVEAEFIRAGIKAEISQERRICTMLVGEKLGFDRWPNLERLFERLYNEPYKRGYHNAHMDAHVTARCLFGLIDKGLI